MKFVFSFLACGFLTGAWGREVILIQHDQDKERAELARTILMRQMHLPAELITVRERKSPCRPEHHAVVHICFDADHEMRFPHMQREIMERSLKIFMELSNAEKNEPRT